MVNMTTLSHIPYSLLESLPELPADLYPLPLTPFEKYLLWDETPRQPMSSLIELHFLDPLQVSVMEEAIAAAMQIHPMLVCTVEQRNGDLIWVHQPDFRHKLILAPAQIAFVDAQPAPIDLYRQPGIQFWYDQDERCHSRLLIQLHHATADGVGLRRFLIDAMTLYAHATTPEKVDVTLRPPWNRVDPLLLQRRADFSDTFAGPAINPLTTWQRIKNAWFFHFQLPKPLRGRLSHRSEASSRSSASEGNANNLGTDSCSITASVTMDQTERSEPLEHLVVDREISAEILEKARAAEIGVNELALALLFETCSLWNQQHGDRNLQSRLRILMPYDLRSRIDLRMPAANRLSFSFLGRTQLDCRDLPNLVQSIAGEIQAMRNSQLPLDFLAALTGAAKYPRLMRWAMRRSRNMATAVLTYAGDISRGMQKYFPEQDGVRIVGDVRLDKILAAPPVRENTHVSLGLCINWGQLCISAAWNRDGLTRQQCREFLQLYYSRWLLWLR